MCVKELKIELFIDKNSKYIAAFLQDYFVDGEFVAHN